MFEDNDYVTYMEMLSDDFDMEEHYLEREKRELLREAIAVLNKEEQKLIDLYFSNNGLTQMEIAEKLHITQGHVSRKIQKIIEKLQRIIRRSYGI